MYARSFGLKLLNAHEKKVLTGNVFTACPLAVRHNPARCYALSICLSKKYQDQDYFNGVPAS